MALECFLYMINQGCNNICEVSPPNLIPDDVFGGHRIWTEPPHPQCIMECLGVFQFFRYSPYKICFFYKSLWRIKTKKDVTNRHRIRYEICAFFRGKTSKHIALLLVVTVFLSKRVFAVLTMHISLTFEQAIHLHRHIVSYVPSLNHVLSKAPFTKRKPPTPSQTEANPGSVDLGETCERQIFSFG